MTDYVDAPFPEHDPRINYFIRGAAIQNFGDFLPAILADELLATPRIEADMYLLVGSVISENHVRHLLIGTDGQREGSVAFWGCGARDAQPLPAHLTRHWHYCSVRGPLTRDALQLPGDTVLGDPGLLAPLFHTPREHPETAGKTVCIAHVHDPKPEEELRAMSGCEVILRPQCRATQGGLRELLDKIASASFVLTGSLHGAIIACAYGRPFAFWNTGHVDVPFKWRDFARSVAIPEQFVANLAEGYKLYNEEIEPSYRPLSMTAILDACPFAVKPSALIRAMVKDGLLPAEQEPRLVELFAALPSESKPVIQHWLRSSAQWRRNSLGLRSTLKREAMQAVARFRRQITPD